MFVMESIDDLWEHIAYVLAYAPNNFPYRDFLPANEQMTLQGAFEQLRKGIHIAYPEPAYEAKRHELSQLLDSSHAAYTQGNEHLAGKLLNEFQDNIFSRRH
jgi:hypothetical protein